MLTAKFLLQINLNGLGETARSPQRIAVFLRLSPAQLTFSHAHALIQLCRRTGKKLFNNSYLYTNKQHNNFPSLIRKRCKDHESSAADACNTDKYNNTDSRRPPPQPPPPHKI